MRLLTIAAALIAVCAAQPVLSRDTGKINQAGAYEQTMKFYLHPRTSSGTAKPRVTRRCWQSPNRRPRMTWPS
jgi:hypothetical protein